jgi:hypothetical protein
MSNNEHKPRLFARTEDVVAIGEGLLAQTLPRACWTHEAHLAACTWLVVCRPEIDAETALPHIIYRYNAAVGGVNDDHQGYHETLTQLYLAGVRSHCSENWAKLPLWELVNRLIESPRGHRDWPLHFYSATRLFSVTARRYLITPDQRGFTDAEVGWACKPRPLPINTEGLDYGNA